MSNRFLDAALSYQARGWQIIPTFSIIDGKCNCPDPTCTHPGKHPRVSGGYKAASLSREYAQDWFERMFKPGTSNIQIHAGPVSGILVIDIDNHYGINGWEHFLDLLQNLRISHDILNTPTVRTGSGGQHLYFKYPVGELIRSSSALIAPGVDIKSGTGLLVAPPSIHLSGKEYVWELEPDEYPLQPFPHQLLLLLKQPYDTAKGQTNTDYVIGNRNSRLTQEAGKMRRAGYPEDGIRLMLHKINQEQCKPQPLPDDEVEQILTSVMGYTHTEVTTVEINIPAMLSTYDKDAPTAQRERFVRDIVTLIAKSNPIAQELYYQQVSQALQISQTRLKALTKYAAAELIKQQSADTSVSLYQNAMQAIHDLVLIPEDENEWANPHNALFRVQSEDGEYVVPFWEDDGCSAVAKKVTRNITSLLRNLTDTHTANDAGKLLSFTADPSSEYGRIQQDVQLSIDKGTLGTRVFVATGPSLYKGIFHAKTSHAHGIYILKQYGLRERIAMRIQTKGVDPAPDPAAFEALKHYWGESWPVFTAHCIASIANLPQHKTSKHALCIVGNPDTGKSTIAYMIQRIVDGCEGTGLSGKTLHKQWAKYLQFRCPVLDNLDRNSISLEALDDFTQLLTTIRMNLEVRYTVSGKIGEGGYPILTSIRNDLFANYEALLSRCIIVHQNPRPEFRGKSYNADKIALAARGHIWWLVEQYLDAISSEQIPEIPGKVRQIAISRAYFWVLSQLLSLSEKEADAQCATLRLAQSSEDMKPLKHAIVTGLTNAYMSEKNLTDLTAKELYTLIRNHAWQEFEDARFKTDGNPWTRLIRRLSQDFPGGIVGDFTMIQHSRDAHRNAPSYSFILNCANVANAPNQTLALVTRTDTSPANVANVANVSARTRGPQLFPDGPPTKVLNTNAKIPETTFATLATPLIPLPHAGQNPANVQNETLANVREHSQNLKLGGVPYPSAAFIAQTARRIVDAGDKVTANNLILTIEPGHVSDEQIHDWCAGNGIPHA
jgi:hypothetical protein